MSEVRIEYVDKLHPIFTKPKRIKIVVGGRGSTKSTGIAGFVAAQMTNGALWCCAREQLNSIEESVHRTMLDEIDRLGLNGFTDTKTSITHKSGGRAFYRGLSRNISSLKSTLSGIDGLWIEEGEDLSEKVVHKLTASVRRNAKDTQKAIELKSKGIDPGEIVKMPEIVITMNRGSRNDAIAKHYLARAEKELERCGYYEDDLLMVVELNYTDMPEDWFLESGLEQERLDDKEKMSLPMYEHKWDGKYLETVENAIIQQEWFDAAVDAHKIERLTKVFKPHGARIASHDPSGEGEDDKSYVLRHGSIIKRVLTMDSGDVDDGCDWATGQAIKDGADWFVWDGDGMGAGLKRQVSINFNGTHIKYHMFRGSLAGSGQDNADKIYMPQYGDKDTKPKTYAETFKNNRSQYYTNLSDRFYNTYRCVVKGDWVDPEEMISIDSEGVENLTALRSQLCRIPAIPNNPNGLIQIMNKKEMKQNDIDSPNESDGVMMSLFKPINKKIMEPLNYEPVRVV